MNTDKTQGKMQLENIKKMQVLMQSNALGNLGLNVKKARQQLEQLAVSFKQKQQALKQSDNKPETS